MPAGTPRKRPGLRNCHPVIAPAGLIFACLLVAAAGATPPSAMSLAYDGNARLLSITITHVSANTTVHYIKEVNVSLNGQLVNDSHYTTQPSPDTWTYTYPVTAQPGDVLSATASCSLFGSATRTLTVTAGTTTAGQPVPAPTTQKSALAAAPLAALAVLVFPRKRLKD